MEVICFIQDVGGLHSVWFSFVIASAPSSMWPGNESVRVYTVQVTGRGNKYSRVVFSTLWWLLTRELVR